MSRRTRHITRGVGQRRLDPVEGLSTLTNETATTTTAETPATQDDEQGTPEESAAPAPAAPPPEQLVAEGGLAALEGQIVTGTVQSVKEFGAFVDIAIGEHSLSGMVHVSEISETFVENIWAHIGEGDQVEVAVMSVRDDGKVDLSMKRADPDWLDDDVPDLRPKDGKDFNRKLRRFMHTSQRSNGLKRRQKRQRLGRESRR